MTLLPNKQDSERILITRLYSAQNRLRFQRGFRATLLWFAIGSVLGTLALFVLWNWKKLPGPWQWLATAGRPIELLWLPMLTAMGGFASQWFQTPSPRQSAHCLDRHLDSQEQLLTAVDWILSEKPRTEVSERLLHKSAFLVGDEMLFRQKLRGLEPVPPKLWLLLLTFLFPLALALYLPSQMPTLPPDSLWLGQDKVEQLTEELRQELEISALEAQQQKELKQLLKKLKDEA